MKYHYLKSIFRPGCLNSAQVDNPIKSHLISHRLHLTPRLAPKRYQHLTNRSNSKRIKAFDKEFWAKRVYKLRIAWWKIRTRYMNTKRWRALVKKQQLQFFTNLPNAHLSKLQKVGVIRRQVFHSSSLKVQRAISPASKEKNMIKVSKNGIWLTNF